MCCFFLVLGGTQAGRRRETSADLTAFAVKRESLFLLVFPMIFNVILLIIPGSRANPLLRGGRPRPEMGPKKEESRGEPRPTGGMYLVNPGSAHAAQPSSSKKRIVSAPYRWTSV